MTVEYVPVRPPKTVAKKSTAGKPRNRAGRLTDIERLEKERATVLAQHTLKAAERKAERYHLQESKRAPLAQIDTVGTLRLLVALSIVSFLTAATLVANATIDIARNMILAYQWMTWLTFGAIEVSVLIFLLMYLLVGSRIDDQTGKLQDSRLWFRLMVAYSSITILSSIFHTLSGWLFDWTNPNMWAGVVLSLVVPFSFVMVSKGLSVVVFARALVLEDEIK